MPNWTRDFFILLSNNRFLNQCAKKWGFRLGAERFVAGTDVKGVTEKVKAMNRRGLSCTVDHLGEFVTERNEALTAKANILEVIETIHAEKLDCHVSVKLTQLGLDIDEEFCYENMKAIVAKAANYRIFINIDMENYDYYQKTLDLLQKLLRDYDNVGTVIQSYLFRAEEDLEQLTKVRLRLVKGAYKESADISYQSKKDIDTNLVKLIKKRLLADTFTSIATHDDRVIDALKRFIKEKEIPYDRFEFQMLYGFRQELQESLVKEGFSVCVYMPFGHDWYGYFMRRLAERPQNLKLLVKDVFPFRKR